MKQAEEMQTFLAKYYSWNPYLKKLVFLRDPATPSLPPSQSCGGQESFGGQGRISVPLDSMFGSAFSGSISIKRCFRVRDPEDQRSFAIRLP